MHSWHPSNHVWLCLPADLSRAIKEAKEASKGTVRTERKLEEKAKKGEKNRAEGRCNN